MAKRGVSKNAGVTAEEIQQDTYRRAVEEHSKVMTKVDPISDRRRRLLESEAAKHGLRIQQKESKGRPKSIRHRTARRGNG